MWRKSFVAGSIGSRRFELLKRFERIPASLGQLYCYLSLRFVQELLDSSAQFQVGKRLSNIIIAPGPETFFLVSG